MKKFNRIVLCFSLTIMPMLVMASNVEFTQSQTIEILTKSVKKLIEEQKDLKDRISTLEGQKSGMIKLPDTEIAVLSKDNGKEQKVQNEGRYIVNKPLVNIRKEASVLSPINETIKVGTVFEGTLINNDWVKMQRGYILKSTIQKIETSKIKEYTLTHKTKTWITPKIGNKNYVETLEAGKKILIYDIELIDNWYKTTGGAFFQK